jgi:hypothetical protein
MIYGVVATRFQNSLAAKTNKQKKKKKRKKILGKVDILKGKRSE